VHVIPNTTLFHAGGVPKQTFTYWSVGVPPLMKPGRQSAAHTCPEGTLPLVTLHPLVDVQAEPAGGAGRELTEQEVAAGAENRQQAG
jgi:hypothetical protein